MKIIKEGKIPEEKTPRCGIFYRGKCSKCGCEFEAHESEFYNKEEIFRDSDFDILVLGSCIDHYVKQTNSYIKCPICEKEIKIKNVSEQRGTSRFGEKEITWY